MSLITKAIKFEIVNTGLHITICFVKNLPSSVYNDIKKDIEREYWFKNMNNSIWTLKILGKWGENSMFITGYDQNGISLEYYKDLIFTKFAQKAGYYIDTSRYTTGMPPTHIAVNNLKNKPNSGDSWANVIIKISL